MQKYSVALLRLMWTHIVRSMTLCLPCTMCTYVCLQVDGKTIDSRKKSRIFTFLSEFFSSMTHVLHIVFCVLRSVICLASKASEQEWVAKRERRWHASFSLPEVSQLLIGLHTWLIARLVPLVTCAFFVYVRLPSQRLCLRATFFSSLLQVASQTFLTIWY